MDTPQPGPAPAPLGAARLVAESFRVLFGSFAFLFPLAFLPALAITALSVFLLPEAMFDPEAPTPETLGAGLAAIAILNILASFLITGITCLAALDALLGKRHSFGEYLAQTLRHLAPIAVLGLMVSVAIGFAAVIFLLPGLYVAARFLPWTPAVVFENAGWSGLGRAQDLTEGYRWPLAGAIMLMGLAALAIWAVTMPIATAASGSLALAILMEALFSGLTYALVAIFSALAYLRLREIREGVTRAELAASFD